MTLSITEIAKLLNTLAGADPENYIGGSAVKCEKGTFCLTYPSNSKSYKLTI